jgi:hypothetical protein
VMVGEGHAPVVAVLVPAVNGRGEKYCHNGGMAPPHDSALGAHD